MGHNEQPSGGRIMRWQFWRRAPRQPAEPEERARWRQWARDIVAADGAWLIVDVETTGLARDADIIEVAAVTPAGAVLIDRLIHPSAPIPPAITALTGITNAMVAAAPRFATAYTQALQAHLASRSLLAYNASFDVRLLRQNIARHCRREWQPVRHDCLMRAYAAYRGERYPAGHRQAGQIKVHKLAEACQQMGIVHDRAHRALGDCLVSAQLLHAMVHQ